MVCGGVSWDLRVFTRHAPPSNFVSTTLVDEGGFIAHGTLDPRRNVLVSQVESGEDLPAFTVDAPRPVESEDLPDELLGFEPGLRFVLEVSSPAAASDDGRALAQRVALRLAETFEGSVYDPQTGTALWPPSDARAEQSASRSERIRVVELAWYVNGPPEHIATTFVGALGRHCPEAMPRRYGDSEPFEHKFVAGQEEALVRWWTELAGVERGKSFSWKASAPCFGGDVSFPDRRTHYPSGEPVDHIGPGCTKLGLSFDGRVLHADPTWTQSVVELLSTLAGELRAFYAAAVVRRNVIARRQLWFDERSERSPIPFSAFTGLPPTPTWLAWFGPTYVPLVEEVFGDRAQAVGEALFFRGGPAPMDADELAEVFPLLPTALVSSRRDIEGFSRVQRAQLLPKIV